MITRKDTPVYLQRGVFSIDAYLDISFVKMLQLLLKFDVHDLRFYIMYLSLT